jgi:hypothetical protein
VSLFVDELKGAYSIVLNIRLKFKRKIYLNREFVKRFLKDWIPACAGMTRVERDKGQGKRNLDPGSGSGMTR